MTYEAYRGMPEPPTTAAAAAAPRRSRLANSWAVVPMRLFLAALFGFAGYAKLTYPGFFSDSSPIGFRATIEAARTGTPVGGALKPLVDHASLFGHVSAYAELAIGAGLLVGCLTRLAALGGMVLTTLIVLSIDWGGVKQYTGSSGWYTSVDIAVAVALTVFVFGGAGPLSIDRTVLALRDRRRAREAAEPSFRDSDIEDSRRRLRGDGADWPPAAGSAGQPGAGLGGAGVGGAGVGGAGVGGTGVGGLSPDHTTQQLPVVAPSAVPQPPPAEHESLWTE
jgi:thiosulfate dehydrogenase [quinone] large subunit